MNLRSLRERAGLKQDEVAARTGLHQTTVSGLEKGEVTNPKLDTLQKLADVYAVDLSDVVAAVRLAVAEAAA